MSSIDKPPRISPWILLGLVLLLAAGLRCRHLGHESFWLDEVFSVESTMGRGFAHRLLPTNTLIDPALSFTDPAHSEPWWKIWPACRGATGDIHPPLAYILLRWWCALFGYSDVSARSLSVVASLAGILLLYLIGRELHGSAVALWGCLLMALASPQILYAQEAKHYALLQAMALSTCLALVRIEKKGTSRARLLTLGVGIVAMLFTHYLSVAVIAALGLYALLRLRGADRKRAIAIFLAAGLIFLIAWGPTLMVQTKDAAADADYFRDGGPGFLLRELQRLGAIPFRLLNEPLPNSEGVAYFTGVVCLLPAIMVRRRPEFLLWAIWIPVTILSVALLDAARHTWLLALIRYTLLAGPAMYLVLAALGSRLHPSIRCALPLICVASCLIALPDVYSQRKSDLRGMARELTAHAKPGEVTIFCCIARPRQNPFHYFIGISYYARPMPGPIVLLDRPADGDLLRQLSSRGRVWVVGDSDEIQDLLPGAQLDSIRLFPNTGNVLSIHWPDSVLNAPPLKAPSP
jgi:hypothetical protein